MTFDPGAMEAALAAAVGDEPVLIAELRLAFREGAERAMAALGEAPDDEAWRGAAWRLKGLAASFGALPLMAAAEGAAGSTRGDGPTLNRLRGLLGELEG